MIYQTVHNAIIREGISCTLTEYRTQKHFSFKGIFQPIRIKNREHTQTVYASQGSYDEAEMLLIFKPDDSGIDFENALLQTENGEKYYIRKCKPFYYRTKILYYVAVAVSCSGEVTF